MNEGPKIWYNEEGLIHREDGPAVIGVVEGYQSWWRNGALHREDGPAIIWQNGAAEIRWWLKGKSLTFTQWADKLNLDDKTRLELMMKWNPDDY